MPLDADRPELTRASVLVARGDRASLIRATLSSDVEQTTTPITPWG
jgi:hypothetical protein